MGGQAPHINRVSTVIRRKIAHSNVLRDNIGTPRGAIVIYVIQFIDLRRSSRPNYLPAAAT